ncbi:hypothetical protein Tco_0128299 [Tanacetum coccineum]
MALCTSRPRLSIEDDWDGNKHMHSSTVSLLADIYYPACHSTSRLIFFDDSEESLPSGSDACDHFSRTVAVSGVPVDRSHVHTHDHDGSEAPDGSPDSILSNEPKPLGKHRPPPPPSILSPGESSYPP